MLARYRGGALTVGLVALLLVLLLAAYGYAHLSTRRLGRRWQPRAHLVVLLLPVVALPVVRVPASQVDCGIAQAKVETN